jgi:Na+-driven multidrug efflux pump
MLLTWSSVTPLLHLFSSSAQIPEEASFLRIRICGLPFLFIFQVCNAFLIASLNSRLLILGALSQALINIFLDYALIFGHFGMPAMGFIGAAWASVISECGAALVVICVLVFSGLGKTYRLFIPVRWDLKMAKVISSLSAPLILQYVISVGFWLVFFLFIEEKGTHAKAISNTMRSVMGLAGIFCWSLCGSVNVMVSNLIGQGRPQDVLRVTTRIALWSGGICSFLLILLNIWPRDFFALFSGDESFIREGISVLRMVSAGMVMMAVANIWLNAITGTGKTKVNLLIEITAVLLYMVYTLYVLKWNYVSLAIAWSNELFYWSFILLFSFLYMKSGKWKGAENIATD